MFYAHFVLTKKGPLARIWLAAHWDKKLTKAHVFETNIDHSVEAILEPKVKLALRTSGHLLLGVVRIYSRKAKYLLSDCNEAFVKIKMAFRPGVVDLPEENREAAVAAITLQENFHDFESFADLGDFDVHVNQSRPEEITMREDLGNIQLVGDDGFGDLAFDDREIARDASHLDSTLYKSPHHERLFDKSKSIDLPQPDQPMDIDINAPITDDGFGTGLNDGAFIGDNFIDAAGGLFEEPTITQVPMVTEELPPVIEPISEPIDKAAPILEAIAPPGPAEQTTLVQNEEEAFALEPIDVTTAFPGNEGGPRKKRRRKLVVDEIKGIQSETMKMQLSDTSDIISTLDLAPPTKKLMHWKETGGVDKLFALASRADRSKPAKQLFTRNLVTQPQEADHELELNLPSDVTLEPPELARDNQVSSSDEPAPRLNADISHLDITHQSEAAPPTPDVSRQSIVVPQIDQEDIFGNSTNLGPSLIDEPLEPQLDQHNYLDEEPPSIAPFSVPPPSVPPPSVGPAFEDLEEIIDQMPENEEQEEKRLTKRSQIMQHNLAKAFKQSDRVHFFDLTRGHYRKQMAAKFYTLLVLEKTQTIEVYQEKSFGDIAITKGERFHEVV